MNTDNKKKNSDRKENNNNNSNSNPKEKPTTINVSTWEKLAVSFGSLPTNLGWAISESLIIPYLLEVRCPYWACSWAWLFSPILSSFIGPLISKWIDQWKEPNYCGWNGRKQFVLILSLISATMMLLIPRSHDISFYVFSSESTALIVVIAMILFTIMDLCHYALLRPIQSLLVDVSVGNDEIYNDVLKLHIIIEGICAMLGFGIAAICLQFDLIGNGMDRITTVFTIGAVLVIISMLICLFFSPNPPQLGTADIPYMFNNNLEFRSLDEDSYTTDEIRQLLSSPKIDSASQNNDDDEQDIDLGNFTGSGKKRRSSLKQKNSNLYGGITNNNDNNEFREEDEISHSRDNSDHELDEHLGISHIVNYDNKKNIESPIQISDTTNNNNNNNNNNNDNEWNTYALHWLWGAQLMGWITMCCVILFWTSFNGINIFHGNPHANFRTDSFNAFEDGVTFGAVGLLIKSFVGVNCSLTYPVFNRWLSTRNLFLLGEYGMAIICISFFFIENKIILLILIGITGLTTQLHLHTSHQLTESITLEMNKTLTNSKHSTLLSYLLELGNVIAPVFIALIGGPVTYGFNENFKYIFFISGVIMLFFDIVITLIFFELLPWKLPHEFYNQQYLTFNINKKKEQQQQQQQKEKEQRELQLQKQYDI